MFQNLENIKNTWVFYLHKAIHSAVLAQFD